jgi:hypothetical protein
MAARFPRKFQSSKDLAYNVSEGLERASNHGTPLDGLDEVAWLSSFNKMNGLSLEHTPTWLSKTERVIDAVDDPINPLCPVRLIHQLCF